LAESPGGALDKHTLSSLDLGCAVKQLIGGRPAQDQCGGLRCINGRWHTSEVAGTQRPVAGIRADHGHIGHTLAKLKSTHAIAKLIDFPDDIIAKNERRSQSRGLRIDVTADRHVCVFHTRGEHADSYLASAGHRQWRVNNLDHVGIAETPDLNNPIARLAHGSALTCGAAISTETEMPSLRRIKFTAKKCDVRYWPKADIGYCTAHVSG